MPTSGMDEYTLAFLAFHADYKPKHEGCPGSRRVTEAEPAITLVVF